MDRTNGNRFDQYACRLAVAGRAVRAGRVMRAALAVFALAMLCCSQGSAQEAKPALSVAGVIEARSAGTALLQIRVAPQNLARQQAFVRLRGLPPTIALSEGHSIAVGAWAVPLAALPRLRIEVPTGTEGKSEITITLVSAEGAVLDEAKAILVVLPAEQAATPAPLPQASALRVQPTGPPVPLARVPQLASGDRDRALKMLQRGNELLASKDFSAAQHFYKRAAEIGLAEAALALARTYDPGEQARIGAVGLQPDAAMARTWYEKARALGSVDADAFLYRLSAAR